MAHWAETRTEARREPKPRRGFPLLLLVLPLLLLLGVGVTWATGGLHYGAWWLTNQTPPTVSLVAPTEPVRGEVVVASRTEPGDRAGLVDAQVDGRPLPLTDPLVVDTAALPDGEHELLITAEDRSWRRNRATARATLRTDNTAPRLALESRPERVPQGSTWLLRIRADEPAAIQARLGENALPVQAGEGYGWAVVGFGPDARDGTMRIAVEGVDGVGNRGEQQASVQVALGDFPVERVEAPASLAPLLGLEVRAEEDRRLAPTYARVTQPRLWDGRFTLPIQGPIVTEFATLRSYNGGPIVGHHAGVDFAAPGGRPVLAPNRGRVALIDEVRLRGRIVVLDHGLGVFTTYAHLSGVDVQPGQVVERGQPFARVGSTGLSTGPHLHWEIWVGGANVNPLEWTERDLP